jgi:tetratricopeptide (TPR) repeat protein
MLPYEHTATQGETALIFIDEKELFNALEALVRNPDLRVNVAANAYDYAKTHRQEGFHSSERVEFYNSLCGKKNEKRLPSDILDRISNDSQAYLVRETEAEKLASEASSSHAKGNVSGEWDFYKEAINAAPSYYIPYLRLGDSLFRQGNAEAIGYLERAISVSPDSLRSRLLSGLALLELKKQWSCRHFEDALTISQLYAPAWDALGRVQEQLGDYGKAAGFFKLALKANPFYSLAVLGLARAFLETGEKDEALGILRVADDILPAHAESRLHLAGLFLKVQRFQDAGRQCEQILQQDPRNREARRLLRGISRDRYHSYAHMIEDFADFSGLSIDDIEANIDRHHKLAADEWNRIDSDVFSVKVSEFYNKSKYYIYDLLSGNCNSAAVIHKLNSFHPMVLKSILQHPGRDFLEFGGGVGLLCEIVLKMGKNVFYLDIPGQVFDFATWRFRKYDLPIHVLCSNPSNLKLEKNFDIIFSDAVIEHVIDPEGVVYSLCHHINEGGLFILLVDLSGNSKQFPMHRNINLYEIQSIVRRNGFTNVAGDGTFCSIWKRTGRT